MRLSFAGIAGIQQIRRLILTGEMTDTSGGMTVRLTDDFGGAANRSERNIPQLKFSNQKDDLIALPGAFTLEVRPKNSKTRSVQLQMFWPNLFSGTALTTAGVRLSAVSAEVGIKDGGGLRRLSPKMRA
jgi:hypothetical protein